MFHQSHDFVINDGDFRTYNHYGQSGIDILYEASSPGATIDSPGHYDRRCFPGTREQYISDITNWATASMDTLPSIYWMKGPAGVGKSAIAQTCAEILGNSGYLGATFFLTVNRHNNPLRLFTTIAYQLTTLLPDYRALVEDKISKDKSIVKKRISSQFKLLIAEPLEQLEKQGRGVGRRAVFIDGLDECADKDSQVEIIEIIASSVRDKSTPFCWAIFSREEPHIVSTFAAHSISFHCHSVDLPISREADQDVELYLRGGFENMLKRRNFVHLSSSWPTAEQIKKLVDAAAGLFAHPACVLRFVDRRSYSGFKEALEAVLISITKPGSQLISPYAELDGLYILILQNVPDDILSSMRLLFAYLTRLGFKMVKSWCIGTICNELGISEIVFQSIYHHLQAVISYHAPPSYPLGEATIDLTRSYYDRELSVESSLRLRDWLHNVHGAFRLYHKSFYDFLVDPARSSTFCVTTSDVDEELFNCLIRQHHHYASTYVIQDSKLVLAPGVASSSISLSWPHGTEFVDSYLKCSAFFDASFIMSSPSEALRFGLAQELAQLDYRKRLLADIMLRDNVNLSGGKIAGYPGCIRALPHTMFGCIRSDEFEGFQPIRLFTTVKQLEELGIIRPYHPQLGSVRAASHPALSHHSRQEPSRTSYGCYEFGHGNTSVVWYWEFDMGKQYFHGFRTMNYEKAMKIFKTEQFKMWEESWVPPP